MSYRIEITRKADKELRKIDNVQRRKIEKAISDLARTPRPDGCKKLTATDAYRIRVGNYRVIYKIIDRELVVTVINAGHRKGIYERM